MSAALDQPVYSDDNIVAVTKLSGAIVARSIQVPITPDVLAWAVETSGYDLSEVARQLDIDGRLITRWLSEDEKPTVTQFRSLARLLRRPTATFFLPDRPKSSVVQVQFRQAPGGTIRRLYPKENLCIREAEYLQRTIAWLQNELGEVAARLPSVALHADVEEVASVARKILGVSLEEQFAWPNNFRALKEWRRAFEASGILVFFMSMGDKSARGFSIWHDISPLIAVNTHWNPAARMYTMFHELGHLLTRTSSICADHAGARHSSTDADIERWCERVGAAALMPKEAVLIALRAFGFSAREEIDDIEIPRKLSVRFRVSLRAAALRLINLGRSSWSLYQSLPPASDAKSQMAGGEGRSRPVIRVDEYGQRTAQLFLHGLNQELINASDVMHYLNVSYPELAELDTLVS